MRCPWQVLYGVQEGWNWARRMGHWQQDIKGRTAKLPKKRSLSGIFFCVTQTQLCMPCPVSGPPCCEPKAASGHGLLSTSVWPCVRPRPSPLDLSDQLVTDSASAHCQEAATAPLRGPILVHSFHSCYPTPLWKLHVGSGGPFEPPHVMEGSILPSRFPPRPHGRRRHLSSV